MVRDITTKGLLRYPGGKTRAVKILDEYIPGDVTSICAPFFGGGSFGIHCASRGITVRGYDSFAQLCIFWNEVLSSPQSLASSLDEYVGQVSKDVFIQAQKRLINMEGDTHSLARDFYIVNRSSFSGATLSGGYSQQAAQKKIYS